MKKILISLAVLFLLTTQVMAGAEYYETSDDLTSMLHRPGFHNLNEDDNNFVAIFNSYSSLGDNALLMWRCFSDELKMFILIDGIYLLRGKNRNVTVQFKFDDGAISPKGTLYLQGKGDRVFFDKDDITAFIKKALSSHDVIMRITNPYTSERITFEFWFEELSEALPKLPCVDSLESIQ